MASEWWDGTQVVQAGIREASRKTPPETWSGELRSQAHCPLPEGTLRAQEVLVERISISSMEKRTQCPHPFSLYV